MGRLISDSGYRFLERIHREGRLSDDEYEICVQADKENDPNIFLRYFTYRPELSTQYCPHCRRPSTLCDFPEAHEASWRYSGLQLDSWQLEVHKGDYDDAYGDPADTIFLLGGPGVGKSTLLAASAIVYCSLNPGFRDISAAPTQRQNEAIHAEYDKWWVGTKGWQIFMASNPTSSDPFVKYHYRSGAEHWVMTSGAFSGGKRGSKSMLSLECDRITYDEAGNDRNFATTYVTLGTRTRGLRADGTTRGIEMSDGQRRSVMIIISNPNDEASADEFNRAIVLARSFPDHTVIEVGMDSNRALEEGQRRAVRNRTILGYLAGGKTEEEAIDYLSGKAAQRGGEVFDNDSITAVIDDSYTIPDEYFYRKLFGSSGMGRNMTFLIPPRKGTPYIITVDPGVQKAPLRNAPVICVWDISDPTRGVLTGLFWGSLSPGKPDSYLLTLRDWIRMHGRCFAFIESTGPQVILIGHKELADVEDCLVTVDLSGSTKRVVQFLAGISASRGRFVLPWLEPPYDFGSMLAMYRYDDTNMPQDVVMAVMVFTYWQYLQGITGIYEKAEDYRDETQESDDGDLAAELERLAESPAGARHHGHTRRRQGHARSR